MTASDHAKLHTANRSKEHQHKLNEAKTGVPFSDEHKQHIKEALNKPDTKKKRSEAFKGRHWYNNGVEQVWAKECPAGYVPGMLKRVPQEKSTVPDAAE